MLILTRKLNDSIQIGDDIVLKVTRIGGDFVKIGIEAPSHVKVLRTEIIGREPNPGAESSGPAGDEA
jgi:carbon storage regulator